MPLLDLNAITARSDRVAVLEGTDDKLYRDASAEDVPDLVFEVKALRLLLAQAKPFLLHNGLLLRLGALGIEADPEYRAIAERDLERTTEWAVRLPSGALSPVEGGKAEIAQKWPTMGVAFRRDALRTMYVQDNS